MDVVMRIDVQGAEAVRKLNDLNPCVEDVAVEENIGEPVYKLDIPGSSSALWYLVLKSNIAPAKPAPGSLVILFRDTLLTTPTFRTLPPYLGMIDKFASPGDTLVIQRAYLAHTLGGPPLHQRRFLSGL